MTQCDASRDQPFCERTVPRAARTIRYEPEPRLNRETPVRVTTELLEVAQRHHTSISGGPISCLGNLGPRAHLSGRARKSLGAPLIPAVPPCPAPFVMPPFRPWVAAGAVASEPRGVGVWANAMPVETNRPAAANRARCFLLILLSLFACLKGNVSKVQLFRLEPAHRHAETTSHIRDCGRRGSKW